MPDPQDRPDSEPSDASTPPAKKLPAKKAAKKAPARKTPAKKAPAKKTPAKGAKSAPPKPAEAPVSLQQRIETNGQLAAAAKDAAAQAKVDSGRRQRRPGAQRISAGAESLARAADRCRHA